MEATQQDTRADCGGCGSTQHERTKHVEREGGDTAIRECPHCGAEKCVLCDMGDDVPCGNCPEDE